MTAGTDAGRGAAGYPLPAAPPVHLGDVPPQPGVNGWAIASLVLSVLGGLVLSITFGIIALVQTKRSGQRGRGLAIVGLAISSMWIALGVIVVVAILLAPAERGDDGQLTGARDIGVFELSMGDCLEAVIESEALRSVPAVPCSMPHVGEVYALVGLPGSTRPGEDELFAFADEECAARLASYSQAAADNPDIGIYYVYPTTDSWRSGDREIVCIATTETPRTGSIQH